MTILPLGPVAAVWGAEWAHTQTGQMGTEFFHLKFAGHVSFKQRTMREIKSILKI